MTVTPDGECVAPLLARPSSPPVMTKATLLGWHFVGPALRDGRPVPPDGEWLIHPNMVMPCMSGLHASVLALDALTYAPDSATHICRVELGGEMVPHGDPVDKYAASGRRILWRADPHPTLQHFARLCALDVAHLWDMPVSVRRYLETGDEAWREPARLVADAALLSQHNRRARNRSRPLVATVPEDAIMATSWAVCGRVFGARYVAKSAAKAMSNGSFSWSAECHAVCAPQAARLEAMMLALEPGAGK